jgi:hypothetical protein
VSLLAEVSALVGRGEVDAAVEAACDGAYALIAARRWVELDADLRCWPADHPPAVLAALLAVTRPALVRRHLPSRGPFAARAGLS